MAVIALTPSDGVHLAVGPNVTRMGAGNGRQTCERRRTIFCIGFGGRNVVCLGISAFLRYTDRCRNGRECESEYSKGGDKHCKREGGLKSGCVVSRC